MIDNPLGICKQPPEPALLAWSDSEDIYAFNAGKAAEVGHQWTHQRCWANSTKPVLTI